MAMEVLLSRTGSVAEAIEGLIRTNKSTFDAALYRFNNQRLARAITEARKRGIRVRIILDRSRYQESKATQELLQASGLPFRLLHGRQGPGSKMHHKFALLDDEVALTGSYNWTLASEEQNFENLLILREPDQIKVFRTEFEALWAAGEEK
jgi:phosphatidylserine/phosphatidylglycerophosphate/cardiolipin synthase-like enzyme